MRIPGMLQSDVCGIPSRWGVKVIVNARSTQYRPDGLMPFDQTSSPSLVVPAEAGIQCLPLRLNDRRTTLGPDFRQDDGDEFKM